jgi:hypothetical protein
MTFDTSVASKARMYDYLLGGKDNYAADREAVARALKVWPDMPFIARANRAILGRAVGYFAREAAVRQFLDMGTGIPTAGNTYVVAQAIAPGSRVVYVDNDRCKSGCAHAWELEGLDAYRGNTHMPTCKNGLITSISHAEPIALTGPDVRSDLSIVATSFERRVQ